MASWVDTDGVQIESPAERTHNSLSGITDKDVLDQICLDFIRRGGTTKGMAKFLKVSARTVERYVERGRLHEEHRKSPISDPNCAILFPINAFTQKSKCVHPDPIPEGRREYCPSCHETGVEGHPAFRHRPGDTESPRIQPPRDESLHGGTDNPKKSPRKPKSKLFRKTRRQATAV